MKRIIKRANVGIEEINDSIAELVNVIRDSDEIDEATKAEMISDLADQLTYYATGLTEDGDLCEIELIPYGRCPKWMN
jgi:hypothetical protein